MSKARHVIPSLGGGWSVRQSGSSRASRTFENQADAVRFAKQAAKKERTDVYIHREDGTVRDTNSYGRSSFASKR